MAAPVLTVGSNRQNFVANNQYNTNNSKKCYYTKWIYGNQGRRTYKTRPEAAANDKGLLTKKTLMPDGIRYYYAASEVTTNIINLNSTAFYQNYVAGGGLSFSVTYDDTTVSGDDYTSMIKDKVGNTVANYAQIGTGTEGDPYQIESTGDWNKFADIVSGGHSFAGQFVELKASIIINIENTGSDTIAGAYTSDSNYKAFSGTFNGNNDTLTFNVGQTEAYDKDKGKPRAPFRTISGATIKNLNVVGTIRSKYSYSAGLVGFVLGKNIESCISSCTSSIMIDCSAIDNGTGNADYTTKLKQWDCSAAGFICENKSGAKITFENCVFDGSIDRKNNESKANRGAGFVAYHNGSSITYKHCLMMGFIDLYSHSNITPASVSTFSRKGSVSYKNGCQYGPNYGGVPQNNCQHASTTVPDGIYRKYTVDSTYYVSEVVIEPELQNMFILESLWL